MHKRGRTVSVRPFRPWGSLLLQTLTTITTHQ